MATVIDSCSKCSEPLDIAVKTGSAKWCNACRAKYQAEYKTLRDKMRGREGFADGVSAMRIYLAEAFEKYDPAIQSFSGPGIARIIRQVLGPALPPD